jgi:regulator of ribonuclease activity A
MDDKTSTGLPRATADLCDEYGDVTQVVAPGLVDFGGETAFAGLVTTLQVYEDNALVRTVLADPGEGRVLVIDGGASLRCALVGGNLAKLAERNQWRGIVVWGAVRDVRELRQCRIGLRALAAQPRKSHKAGRGRQDVPITIGGVIVHAGDWLAADEDGVIVAPRELG